MYEFTEEERKILNKEHGEDSLKKSAFIDAGIKESEEPKIKATKSVWDRDFYEENWDIPNPFANKQVENPITAEDYYHRGFYVPLTGNSKILTREKSSRKDSELTQNQKEVKQDVNTVAYIPIDSDISIMVNDPNVISTKGIWEQMSKSGAEATTTTTVTNSGDSIPTNQEVKWKRTPNKPYISDEGVPMNTGEYLHYMDEKKRQKKIREAAILAEKKPKKINKSEEIFLNYNELADELAIIELKAKYQDKYDDLETVKEYSELTKKYVNIILKHERNEE